VHQQILESLYQRRDQILHVLSEEEKWNPFADPNYDPYGDPEYHGPLPDRDRFPTRGIIPVPPAQPGTLPGTPPSLLPPELRPPKKPVVPPWQNPANLDNPNYRPLGPRPPKSPVPPWRNPDNLDNPNYRPRPGDVVPDVTTPITPIKRPPSWWRRFLPWI